MFQELAQHYAQGRAKNNLVFAGMHDDKSNNLHYHIVISSNAVNDSKRLRFSKAEFQKFKVDFEKLVLERYPQLEQEIVIQRTSSKAKVSQKGEEMKRRTGKLPERDRVKEFLRQTFDQCFTHQEFIDALDKAGYDFYIRGKNPGVKCRESGRPYRLSTLNLLEQLEALDDAVFNKAEPQNTDRQQTKRSQSKPSKDHGQRKTTEHGATDQTDHIQQDSQYVHHLKY